MYPSGPPWHCWQPRRCSSRSTSSRSPACQGFAWQRFFEVGKWSLLAYVVIAGMIEYVFLRDHVSGGALVVLTLSLAVFAVHVPMLVGFTVARYADPNGRVAA